MAQDEKNKPNKLKTEMNEGLIKSFVETILPKVKPFIKPAVDKFEEFLGEDEKTIIIRKLKNGPSCVIIFDNNKLDDDGYEIRYSTKERIFICNKEEIFTMVSITDFMDKILTGEFSK